MRAAQMSKAEAANVAGIHPSTVSRILGEEIQASPEHVEALLAAIVDESDRRHCLREYLFDQAPEDYRAALIIHFGATEEPRPRARTDSLRHALDEIEEAATGDRDLRRLIVDLAKVVGFSGAETRAREKAAGARDADKPAARK